MNDSEEFKPSLKQINEDIRPTWEDIKKQSEVLVYSQDMFFLMTRAVNRNDDIAIQHVKLQYFYFYQVLEKFSF